MPNVTPTFDDVIEHFEAEAEKIKPALTATLRTNVALGEEQPKMPTRRLPRGVFLNKDGLYWIRYPDKNGTIHREKAGPFLKQASAFYHKRKSEVREDKFFPEKIKQQWVLFGEIAKDYLAQVRQPKKRDKAHDEQRVKVLLEVP